MKQLIRMDKHWIPDQPGYSLYIRPTMSTSHPRHMIGYQTLMNI